METEQRTAVTVREVPTDLWRRLKIQAAIEGTTVQVQVAKALEHYLKSA
jgi:plasmid stability protein